MKKTGKNIFIFGLSIFAIVLQSCYTNKPIARNVSSPDYNKRVNVSGAQYRKKGNAIDVVFNVGLIGAGAFGGYNADLLQKQTENGREPVKAANAAIGALAGATVAYLIDQLAGKEKRYDVNDPNKWIQKANEKYKFLSGNASDFTMIHSSVESDFKAKNIADVKDFKKIFPNSSYTDKVAQQILTSSDAANVAALSEIYPQYNDQINQRYLQLALEQTSTFSSFKERIDKYKTALPEVNLNIDYKNEEQIKNLFAQFDKNITVLGKGKVREYKNNILDGLTVIKTNIDQEYEDVEYNKIANAVGYTSLFKFASRFPNGKYTKSVTEKANTMKLNSYKKDYQQIEAEVASLKSKIANKQNIDPLVLSRYLNDFSYYSDYDPDRVQSKIASAQTFLQYAKYYAAYTDVQQTTKNILRNIENYQFTTSTVLREKIDYFNQLSGSDPDNVKQYINNISKLCIIIDGMTVPIPDSYREFSLGGAAVGVIGAIVSGGNLRGMALAKPMNEKLFNEHKDVISKAYSACIDDFGKIIKSGNDIQFGENIILSDEAKKSIVKRVIEMDNTLIATYNNDVDDHNKLVAGLGKWSLDNYSSSSSSSSSSSNSSSSKSTEKDIDPNKIDFSNISITTTDVGTYLLCNCDDSKDVKFDDGSGEKIGGRIFYDKNSSHWYISVPMQLGALSGTVFYDTAQHAKEAIYVSKKYNKLRTIGEK